VSTAPTHVVIIVDGWTRRVFDSLLGDGNLPELSDWLGGGARYLNEVVSVVPSISISSHSSLLTGRQPKDHGIPGHRWLSRADGRVRNYIGPGISRVNGDLFTTTPTIFECSATLSTVTQSLVTRGASRVSRLPTQRPDRLLRHALRQIQKEPNGLHVIWLPRGDAMSHRHGPDSHEVAIDMVQTSKALGAFIEETQKACAEASILVVPDHGQRVIKSSANINQIREWAPEYFGDSEIVINPQVRMRVNPEESVVLTGGDSSVSIYTRSSASHPAAVADMVRELANSGNFAFLVDSSADPDHYLVSKSGLSHLVHCEDSECAEYTCLKGLDPLGILTLGETRHFPLDNPVMSHRYPDFFRQFLGSRVRDRSADVVGFARPEQHFYWGPRPGWNLGRHRGSHGGAEWDEVVVGALFSGTSGDVSTTPIRSDKILRSLGMTSDWARRCSASDCEPTIP